MTPLSEQVFNQLLRHPEEHPTIERAMIVGLYQLLVAVEQEPALPDRLHADVCQVRMHIFNELRGHRPLNGAVVLPS